MSGTSADIPKSIDDISPDFLSDVLASFRADPSTQVRDFEIEPTARGFGSLSIHRLDLRCSSGAERFNQTVVLKVLGSYVFPPDAPSDAVSRYRTDQIREINFYKGMLGRPLPDAVHRPEPLWIIDDGEQRWIFMEDLGDRIPGPKQSVDDSLRAVANLAALHAQWWERDDLLGRHEWLAPLNQDTTLWEGLSREIRLANFDRAAAHPDLRHLYTDGRIELLRDLGENWRKTHERVEALPRTLIHGDFGAHNFGHRDLDGRSQTILVDWDQVGVGTPGMELGRANWLPTLLGAEPVPDDVLLTTYCDSLERWLGQSVDREAIQEGYDLYFCTAGLFVLAFYALGEGPNDLKILMDVVVAGSERVLNKIEYASRRWLGF